MQLLTQEIRRQLAPYGTTDSFAPETKAVVKFFTPDAGWTWFATEFDGEDLFFGLAVGFEAELGSFRLSELREVRGKLRLPVERDRSFGPTCFTTILEKHAPHLLFDEDILRKVDRAIIEDEREPF